jgi:hypothetical protein
MKMLKIKVLLFVLLSLNNSFGQSVNKAVTCVMAKNIYLYFDKINSDSLKIFLSKSRPECNLILVDSVINKFIVTGEKKCFLMLERIQSFSDGELSEYLVEKTAKIYHRRFLEFFEYLYDDYQRKRKGNLGGLLVESWSSEASVSNNRNQTVKRIKSNATRIVSKAKGNVESKLQYLDSLLKEINPAYLD